ncbi:MAG: hypothetical protein WB775_16285, partial [Burkholderiaceae bacterium]
AENGVSVGATAGGGRGVWASALAPQIVRRPVVVQLRDGGILFRGFLSVRRAALGQPVQQVHMLVTQPRQQQRFESGH